MFAPSNGVGAPALGLVILFASRTILPEQIYTWPRLVSWLLVAALGLTILRKRLLSLPAFGRHTNTRVITHTSTAINTTLTTPTRTRTASGIPTPTMGTPTATYRPVRTAISSPGAIYRP